MLSKHIKILEKNIYNIYKQKTDFNIYVKDSYKSYKKHEINSMHINMPYIFEYYSAIHMTKLLNKPFYVYKDFSKEAKIYQNFPVKDKGIDLVDDCLDIVGQVKYYSDNNSITYGKLSTFLASEKLVRKRLIFYLIRSQHCDLSNDIQSMIDNQVIYDIPINRFDFLKDVQIIYDKYEL